MVSNDRLRLSECRRERFGKWLTRVMTRIEVQPSCIRMKIEGRLEWLTRGGENRKVSLVERRVINDLICLDLLRPSKSPNLTMRTRITDDHSLPGFEARAKKAITWSATSRLETWVQNTTMWNIRDVRGHKAMSGTTPSRVWQAASCED